MRSGVTRLAARLRAERSPDALSGMKVAVLARLLADGAATASQIALSLRQQPQSLTRVLADLQADGLASRTPSSTDRRASVLAITAAGRRALAADMRERDRWLAAAMATLPPADVRTLLEASAVMRRLCDDAG